MSIEQMRSVLGETYTSDSWKQKLRVMPENQVVAVYRRLQSKGQIK